MDNFSDIFCIKPTYCDTEIKNKSNLQKRSETTNKDTCTKTSLWEKNCLNPYKQRLAVQNDSAKNKQEKNTTSKKRPLAIPIVTEKENIPHSIPNKRSKHGTKAIPKKEKDETTDKTRTVQK